MRVVTFHPTDSTRALASGYNGNAFYSTDGGVTWLPATGLPAVAGFVVGRVEVAYAPSSPDIVYASIDNSSGQLYASGDGGQTYVLRNTGNNYSGNQGWYDNTLWVDPTTTNVVFVGGLDVWRSTDGGATLNDIGGYVGGVHPDQHILVGIPGFNSGNGRGLFIGNDGGIFRAADAYTVSSAADGPR